MSDNSTTLPATSYNLGDAVVGPVIPSLQGAVIWIPEPSGFNSLMQVRGPVGAFLKSSAEQVQELAKAFAPVDTGDLQASISITYGKDETNIWADVGTDVYYGPFQEFGTSRNPPHPFLRPALMSVMGDISDRASNRGIEDVDSEFVGTEGRFEWDADSREWGVL